MSNILSIKHGSLGDIAQASGAIQDISEHHFDDNVYLLTTKPYLDLFKKNQNMVLLLANELHHYCDFQKYLELHHMLGLYHLMNHV